MYNINIIIDLDYYYMKNIFDDHHFFKIIQLLTLTLN